jgi:hypothetical protein
MSGHILLVYFHHTRLCGLKGEQLTVAECRVHDHVQAFGNLSLHSEWVSVRDRGGGTEGPGKMGWHLLQV